MKSLKLILVFGLLSVTHYALAPVAAAQFGNSDGITVTGSAESKGRADLMRMSITVEAKAADLKGAIESLAEKKKKATIKLEKLGAIEDSIQFDEISTGGQSDTSSMMQQMRRSFGDDPRMAKMMKVKPPVTVSVTLTADWEIDGEGDELLIACDEMKQKVTEVDIAGAKEEDELSEEQAELAEEMAEMMSQYGGRPDEPAGTPSFYYVRRIDAETHDKLTAEAFANAKAKAMRLARATQFELGKVKTLASREDTISDYSDYYGYGGPRSAIPSGRTLEDGSIEAVSESPTNVEHSATIAVVFEIKQ